MWPGLQLFILTLFALSDYGSSRSRIKRYSFGKKAELGQWPWQVLLVTGPKDYNVCGGSLISDQWVLTAGHCVKYQVADPMAIKVIAGIVKKDDPKGIQRDIAEIHTHPKYEMVGHSNDVALIKLKTPVPFSKIVKPACLNLSPKNVSGLKCVGTGWGRDGEYGPMPNHLQVLSMNVSDLEACKKIHMDYHEHERVNDNHICMIGDTKVDTYWGTGHGGGCGGDSGGPLVCKVDNKWLQIGVTWSATACEQNPSIYNLVDRYSEWIVKTSGYKPSKEC